MRKLAGLAVVVLAFALVTLATPVAAESPFDYGARLNLIENCMGTVEYPAATSFWVGHGWYEMPWGEASMEVKRAFVSPASHFELYVDGELQGSALHAGYFPATDAYSKLYVTQFHDGLSGTHEFVGVWFMDGSYPGVGGAFHEAVLTGWCGVDVTFV